MTSPESIPVFDIPLRTDHNGEHPRFRPPRALVTMVFYRREIMTIWKESQSRRVSIESVIEMACRLYRETWDNQKAGGRVIIYRKDGSMSELKLK